jgi:hypothetical protein
MNHAKNGDARAEPRFFVLLRDEDVSGVSGTGVVAEGCVFGNGRVVLQWLTNGLESLAIHESIESLEQIHGHGGRTRIMFLDERLEIPKLQFKARDAVIQAA